MQPAPAGLGRRHWAPVWAGALFGLGAAWLRPAFATSSRLALQQGIPPIAATALIYGAAAAIALARLAAAGRLGELPAAWNSHRALLLGVMGAGIITNLAVIQGLQVGEVSLEAVISRTDMFWTILIGRLWFGDRIRPAGAAGVALMMAGAWLASGVLPWVGILLGGGVGSTAPPPAMAATGWFLLSAFAVSVNAAFIKQLLRRGVLASAIVAVNTTAVTLAAVLFSAWREGGVVDGALAGGGGGLVWAVLAGALVMGGIEFQYRCLSYLPLWAARCFALATPVTALGFGWLLGEQLTAARYAGAGLVVVGGVLAVRSAAGAAAASRGGGARAAPGA